VLPAIQSQKTSTKRSMFIAHKHIPRRMFKDTRRYVLKATTPCVLTYACVRIRWLVRCAPGPYRLPATAHQWSGLVARMVLVRCMSTIQSGLSIPALDGGCAQGALGRAGIANSTGLLTCAQPPPFF
jgi:hypothetical protein